MSKSGLGFCLTLFLATFIGSTVLSAAGFALAERVIILVVVAVIYRTVIAVLGTRTGDQSR
jgi:hypothetical protein